MALYCAAIARQYACRPGWEIRLWGRKWRDVEGGVDHVPLLLLQALGGGGLKQGDYMSSISCHLHLSWFPFCPFIPGPHLQTDEKWQLRPLSALQRVPGPADGQEEGTAPSVRGPQAVHTLFLNWVTIVFYLNKFLSHDFRNNILSFQFCFRSLVWWSHPAPHCCFGVITSC